MSSSSSYLAETLSSLSQSAAVLKSLSFSSRAVLPPSVLSPDDWFEHHLIRDAAPAELALYEPNPASYPVVQLDVDDPALLIPQDEYEANRLAVAKRKAPKRAQIAQEALKAGGEAAGGAETDAGEGQQRENNPQRCLMTAQKLLNYYAMPRAQEHVQALHSQLVGLMDSIRSTEEALRRPPSRTAPQPQHDQSYYRQLELEDEIKREKLELLALEQIKADKQAEIDALARNKAAAATTAKPRPRTSVPSTDSAATSGPNAIAAGPRPLRPRTSRPSSGTSPRASRPARPSDPAPPSRRRPSGPPAAPTTAAAAASVPMPPASPARRPIGRPSVPSVQSAMKRRVEQARAKMQASQQATPNRSQAFAAAAAGRRSSGIDTRAQQEEEEEEEDGAATPKGPKRVGDGVGNDGHATEQELPPPVPTVSTIVSATATSPSERKQPPPLRLPAGVTVPELEGANKTIWSTSGESSGLKQWMRKWARETGANAAAVEGERTPWSETIEVLEFALAESAKASAQTPGSPSSQSTTSFATSTTAGAADENAPPAPWSPAQVVEAQLCYLLLSTFSGRSTAANPGQDDLPALNIILRETAIPLSSSIAVGGNSTSTSQAGLSSRKTPHLAMAALKVHLGAFAKRRGWTEEMGTTAIYALVSRQTVKIDRRGREGAAVGFKAVEL